MYTVGGWSFPIVTSSTSLCILLEVEVSPLQQVQQEYECMLISDIWTIFQESHGEYKLHFDDLMMMLTRWVGLFSDRSLKQQPRGRHVTPFGHVILISSQLVFALCSYYLLLCGQRRSNKYRPGHKPTIYHTLVEQANHYITDAVFNKNMW